MLKIRTLRIPTFEKVVVAKDRASKLHAIIAIHSTRLGPSLGGVRMWPYAREKDALEDSLRLAKAMTYKAAISNLRLGGGKAVVMGNPSRDKSRDLFLALGELIHTLHGKYIAAEDSGIKADDLNLVAQKTPYVTGTTTHHHGSGDPSPATARGVLEGIKVCAREALGAKNLSGVTVAVQGVGQVGLSLAKLLDQAGVNLIVSDVSRERISMAENCLRVKVVSPSRIHSAPAEIFAPCALGGILNPRTIPDIRAKIVAGGANNQFEKERTDSLLLMKRGIVHAPDYVINAGGLIQLYVKEILRKQDITPWIRGIGETLEKIFAISRKENLPPLLIANRLAEARIKKKKTF